MDFRNGRRRCALRDRGGRIRRLPAALGEELEIMTANYRTGMGTGAATVTPANSCVQDSSKALYFALARLQRRVEREPAVARYLDENPDAKDARDARTLFALASTRASSTPARSSPRAREASWSARTRSAARWRASTRPRRRRRRGADWELRSLRARSPVPRANTAAEGGGASGSY
jgi:predicted Abi (CAAX) family protease